MLKILIILLYCILSVFITFIKYKKHENKLEILAPNVITPQILLYMFFLIIQIIMSLFNEIWSFPWLYAVLGLVIAMLNIGFSIVVQESEIKGR